LGANAVFASIRSAGGGGKRGVGAGGGDYGLDTVASNVVLDAADLFGDELTHARQLFLARRIVLQEFTRQAHGAERQTGDAFDVVVDRDGELTASATEVNHEYASMHQLFVDGNAEVDEPTFFEAG